MATEKGIILHNVQVFQRELGLHAMDPDRPPKLLVVTKNQPIQTIKSLLEAGISEIGENRVQEIVKKYPELSNYFTFHMIGRLQTNKIKYIIHSVCMVQSLDNDRLAQSLDTKAQAAGLRVPVLVQVNIGEEAQKGGVAPEDTEAFVRQCARLPGIWVRGLMAMMPAAADQESLRPLFRRMRTAYERLRSQAIDGVEISELSMGMSSDWRIAAQEGATMVRIGSAIFGDRAKV